MTRMWASFLLLGAFAASTGAAQAGALRVFPVSIDVPAPGAAKTITLRNEGRTPLSMQARVFRWTLDEAGEDKLEPTADVVVSPPSASLRPGADYVIRVVRPGKLPPVGEENYRLFIDELPSAGQLQSGTVALLIRQSIPVFFSGADVVPPLVSWQVRSSGRSLIVTATNKGTKRLKVADLVLKTSAGTAVAQRRGLAGYVLGGSVRIWTLPSSSPLPTGAALELNASSDSNRIAVKTTLLPAN